MIEVLKAGVLATVQDGGRPGLRAQGVPAAGAMDTLAMQVANRLLAKAPDAPLLEITFGQTQLRVQKSGWVALTGADLGASLDDQPITPGWRFAVKVGQLLHFRQPKQGFRAYLAFSGELTVPQVLGSASVDVGAGFNTPLVTGQQLHWQPGQSFAEPLFVRLPRAGRLRLLPGPHYDSFDRLSQQRLWHHHWNIDAQSNRMGYRLSGPRLSSSAGDQLPSQGVLPGVIQVPGNGQPIILGPDAQATGGYPIIAVVINADRWQLGQWGPGRHLSFLPCSPAEADFAWQQQQQYLANMEAFLAAH